MTHEYVIAVGGRIQRTADEPEAATAIAWAADRVLAVGPDELVRAISRGDSTFLDLGGCVVTAAPGADGDDLEPGSPADLDFWDGPRIVARVRAGRFTEGDEHRGPFQSAVAPATPPDD